MINHRLRKNHRKSLPSSCSPNIAYSLYEKYHGEWCLQPVNVAIVEEIMEALSEGEDILNDWGVLLEFENKAGGALMQLGLQQNDVNLRNVWTVFEAILPLLEDGTDTL
jgi:SET domain-containing protein